MMLEFHFRSSLTVHRRLNFDALLEIFTLTTITECYMAEAPFSMSPEDLPDFCFGLWNLSRVQMILRRELLLGLRILLVNLKGIASGQSSI